MVPKEIKVVSQLLRTTLEHFVYFRSKYSMSFLTFVFVDAVFLLYKHSDSQFNFNS